MLGTYDMTLPRHFGYPLGRAKERILKVTTKVKASTRSLSHKRNVRTTTSEVVKFLRENLGVTLTSVLAAVDSRTIARWIADQVTPRQEAEMKLRAAYQIFHLIGQEESPATVRAWFMGMNEQLEDLSPAEAIAAGRARDVLVAARSFISYG